MSAENRNILKSLFDIKPVDETGRVDLGKIQAVSSKLDLSRQSPSKGTFAKVPFEGGNQGYLLRNTTGPFPGLGKDYYGQTKNQNSTKLLEKYINSKLNIRRELKAIGAKVEKGGIDARPRIRPIPNSIKYKVVSIKNQKSEMPDTGYLIPNTEYKNLDKKHETALRQINERITLINDEIITGEPRRIYPFELMTSDVPRTSDVRPSPEIESWIRYATKSTRTNTDSTPVPEHRRTRAEHGSRQGSTVRGAARTVADRLKNLNFERIKLPKFNPGSRLMLLRLNLNKKRLAAYALTGLLAFVIFTSFGQYGINLKNEVMKESNLAVANLERANDNLRAFDFEAASSNFAEAYEEFSKAGESLNFMGASLTSLFAELPGFDKLTAGGAGKLKSAKNLVEAGKLLAEAGKSMSEAVNSLSQTSSILRVNLKLEVNPQYRSTFGDLKQSLMTSGNNLSKASALLAKVSHDDLPEDKREAFLEFQSKLPEFERVVSGAVGYTLFLERFLGAGLATSDDRGTSDVTKKYLVLFQNSSELRPTGGFSGTYAVVTFKDGRLDGFLVDDVYNLDGQLKENIIPPKQLQHITPNWGMRDANWFIDFSASAQKVMEFFSRAAGYEVDGVITMSPRMISDILKVVGPIEMPEYGFAVSDENFLSTIQAEVEYGDNREQPKQVVKDMAPRLLEKIYSAKPDRWLDIFNVFVSGLDQKDILMYFKDLSLESFAAEKDFAGLIKDTDGDYLMVTLTNVKGSKTDRVTDNFLKLNSQFTVYNSQPVIKHRLTITRQHNGGDTKYGFYNKQNPAYVRVLVPEGSELLSISGNSDPGHKQLINYSGTDFKQDNDLFDLESSFRFDDDKGVGTYKESGKTGFAFWLITDPGKQRMVELEYVTPLDSGNNYGIYIQKQPGLEVDNFEFRVGDDYIYNGEFDEDLELRFKAHNLTYILDSLKP